MTNSGVYFMLGMLGVGLLGGLLLVGSDSFDTSRRTIETNRCAWRWPSHSTQVRTTAAGWNYCYVNVGGQWIEEKNVRVNVEGEASLG